MHKYKLKMHIQNAGKLCEDGFCVLILKRNQWICPRKILSMSSYDWRDFAECGFQAKS